MEQAKVVNIEYQYYQDRLARSENEYQKLLKDGFKKIKDSNNTFPINMAKKTRIAVTIKNDDNSRTTLDIKSEFLKFYGRKKYSKRLYYRFLDDIDKGHVKVYTDGEQLYLRAN